jgi:hypothetical protein
MPSIDLTDAEWSLITAALRARMLAASQSKEFGKRAALLRKICYTLRDQSETPAFRHARLTAEEIRKAREKF